MQASAQPENKSGHRLNREFDEGQFINEKDIETLNKYIRANLVGSNSNRYRYGKYNYLNKLYIVIRWRKEHNLLPAARKGEMICKNELINFFQDKKHADCCGKT